MMVKIVVINQQKSPYFKDNFKSSCLIVGEIAKSQIVVPWERLELSTLARYASEAYAYTNSATTANLVLDKSANLPRSKLNVR